MATGAIRMAEPAAGQHRAAHGSSASAATASACTEVADLVRCVGTEPINATTVEIERATSCDVNSATVEAECRRNRRPRMLTM
jgi:hypothetical protein